MQVHACEASDRSTSMSMPLGNMSGMTSKIGISCQSISLAKSEAESPSCRLKNIEQDQAKIIMNKFVNGKTQRYVYIPECLHTFLNINTSLEKPHPMAEKRITACEHDPQAASLTCMMENPAVWNEGPIGKTKFIPGRIVGDINCSGTDIIASPAKNVSQASAITSLEIPENVKINEAKGGKSSMGPGKTKEEMNHLVQSFSTAPIDGRISKAFRSMNDVTPVLDREPMTHEESQALLPAVEHFISQKQLSKCTSNTKMVQSDALTSRLPSLLKPSKHWRAFDSSKEKLQFKTNHKRQKLKQNNSICIKEKGKHSFSISSKVILHVISVG